MKTKLYINILFCLVAVSSWAQTFKNTYTPSANAQEYETFKSPQAMQTTAHDGTIYEPFSSTTPSDQSAVGEAQNSGYRPGTVHRDFINPSDPGQQSNEYPLGDAVLPLMLCALVFCGVIALRRKRAALKR